MQPLRHLALIVGGLGADAVHIGPEIRVSAMMVAEAAAPGACSPCAPGIMSHPSGTLSTPVRVALALLVGPSARRDRRAALR